MPSKPKASKISATKFKEVEPKLQAELQDKLNSFKNEPIAGSDEDIPDIPVIDSKCMIKLSPTVDHHIGIKIEPGWLEPGGYSSAEDAVTSLMRRIEQTLSSN